MFIVVNECINSSLLEFTYSTSHIKDCRDTVCHIDKLPRPNNALMH